LISSVFHTFLKKTPVKKWSINLKKKINKNTHASTNEKSEKADRIASCGRWTCPHVTCAHYKQCHSQESVFSCTPCQSFYGKFVNDPFGQLLKKKKNNWIIYTEQSVHQWGSSLSWSPSTWQPVF
jgi:hypothetical protein